MPTDVHLATHIEARNNILLDVLADYDFQDGVVL